MGGIDLGFKPIMQVSGGGQIQLDKSRLIVKFYSEGLQLLEVHKWIL